MEQHLFNIRDCSPKVGFVSWGGYTEIVAACIALGRPIVVYTAASQTAYVHCHPFVDICARPIGLYYTGAHYDALPLEPPVC